MGLYAQTIFMDLEKLTCCDCGIIFGVPSMWQKKRREDAKFFYCPNGHSQHYPEDTEKKRLQRELEQEKKRRAWAESSRDMHRSNAERQSRRAASYKGIATKTKKRVGNGVCPCCNRTFQNLMNHMKTKHPKYVKAGRRNTLEKANDIARGEK